MYYDFSHVYQMHGHVEIYLNNKYSKSDLLK